MAFSLFPSSLPQPAASQGQGRGQDFHAFQDLCSSPSFPSQVCATHTRCNLLKTKEAKSLIHVDETQLQPINGPESKTDFRKQKHCTELD